MKPPPFGYVAAASVEEVVAILAGDESAKVLAGGQSLVPLLALRLARPSVLVDVNGLGLDAIEVLDGELRIGALVRHSTLERDPLVRSAAPVLAEAAALIGHAAIRHRGTIGGSLAHADPVAELPAALVALGGSVEVVGPDGRRSIPADTLFEGFLTTAIRPDELLVEVRVPISQGGAFREWAPRAGDFALAGVAVAVSDGTTRVAACGVGGRPLDLTGSSELGAAVLAAGGDEDVASLVERLAADALAAAT